MRYWTNGENIIIAQDENEAIENLKEKLCSNTEEFRKYINSLYSAGAVWYFDNYDKNEILKDWEWDNYDIAHDTFYSDYEECDEHGKVITKEQKEEISTKTELTFLLTEEEARKLMRECAHCPFDGDCDNCQFEAYCE